MTTPQTKEQAELRNTLAMEIFSKCDKALEYVTKLCIADAEDGELRGLAVREYNPDVIKTRFSQEMARQLLPFFTQELEKQKLEVKTDSYQKGRNSVGGESVSEAWERGRRAGMRAFELQSDSEYFKTRESIIEILCGVLWMKPWDEVKGNARRFEYITGFMRHFDQYVDKRIEDSYSPTQLKKEISNE